MGHSAGGTTLLANTRLSCCIDTRIRATAYVEPAATFVAALFGENYSARVPPTLTLQGEVDFPITPEASREFNASLEPPKILVEISGGNHVNIIERFSEEPDPLLEDTVEIMIAFFDAFLAEHPQGLEPALESLREHGHTAVVDLDGSEEQPPVQG
jgi:hypothetical protein